jgi:hypothetical protein
MLRFKYYAFVLFHVSTLAILNSTTASASSLTTSPASPTLMIVVDEKREREIPLALYYPVQKDRCTKEKRCPVALLSPGYGVGYLDYSFIANTLNRLGYLMVGVEQQLPGDEPIKTTGDIYNDRSPMWARGAQNLRYVQSVLSKASDLDQFDLQRPILIGHSNGGDISAWLVRESPEFAAAMITLDHRRVALPQTSHLKVLSIRASDFEADPGVLPTNEEQRKFGICITTIPGARHNDMYDAGPVELKTSISQIIEAFLQPESACQRLWNTRN